MKYYRFLVPVTISAVTPNQSLSDTAWFINYGHAKKDLIDG